MTENNTGINVITSLLMLITTFCVWVYVDTQNGRKAWNKGVSDAELRYVDDYIRSVKPIG